MELKYDLIEETVRPPSSHSSCNTSYNTIEYNSVDDIIQKYKQKNYAKYSNPSLNRNVGNHALLPTAVRTGNLAHNSSKYDGNETIMYNNNEQFYEKISNLRCETNNHYINKFTFSDARLASNEKVYQDKTTYCRPVHNCYNEQFIYKTMQRNARLKNLVRKLAIARQREKENVSWNNFINDLKTKHSLHYDNQNRERQIHEEPDTYITSEIIDDYYKTRFSCIQSKPCRHLLQDFYGTCDESHSTNFIYDRHDGQEIGNSDINSYLSHNRNSYCYPTSSQGRLIIERRRREQLSKQQWNKHVSLVKSFKDVANQGNYIKSNIKINRNLQINDNNCYQNNLANSAKTSAVQTDMKMYPDFTQNRSNNRATYKTEDFCKTSNNNLEKFKDIKTSHSSLKQISLTSIDDKLQTLIESLNKFLNEIKLNKTNKRSNNFNTVKCKNCSKEDNNNQIGNVFEIRKIMKTIDRVNNGFLEFSDSNKNKLQSTSKSDKMTQGVDVNLSTNTQIDKYKNRPCSVQVDFEIPTKDNSTEVTKSLSKHDDIENKDAIVEESFPEHSPRPRMTIAINTDPISILGILRISTDTIKQLLSYMPNIDSYLPLIQFPQARKVESHYICNICGADFNKPSQLSDHIRAHDLGKTRDCCVCRHVLDMARKYPGLFKCQYCGQLFARAYCCELHQESCAKRFGRHHDIDSNLLLLR